MLRFTITKDIRCLKTGQEVSINLDEIRYITLVGANGTGKSTLFHALRAKFPRKKEVNLIAGDLKKLLECIQIETDYEDVFFLDTVFDDPSDMNNCYDACSYVDSGNFSTRNKSHGQKSMTQLGIFLEKLLKEPAIKKTLIVFDEVDTGLDLKFQNAFINIAKRLMTIGYHVIIITHNPIIMLQSGIVYDLESALHFIEPITNSKDYLNNKINFSKLLT